MYMIIGLGMSDDMIAIFFEPDSGQHKTADVIETNKPFNYEVFIIYKWFRYCGLYSKTVFLF